MFEIFPPWRFSLPTLICLRHHKYCLIFSLSNGSWNECCGLSCTPAWGIWILFATCQGILLASNDLCCNCELPLMAELYLFASLVNACFKNGGWSHASVFWCSFWKSQSIGLGHFCSTASGGRELEVLLQLNLPCRMMGKAGPPLTPSVSPQLHACSCFPLPSPPLQALPHNLALGHLQIRAGSQTHTRGSSGNAALHARRPACACQCRLLAAIRAGGESLLSQLLPDPRVMKVGFKGAEIEPGRGSKHPACLQPQQAMRSAGRGDAQPARLQELHFHSNAACAAW